MRIEWNDTKLLSAVDAICESATKEGAEIIAKDMKANCPVSKEEIKKNKYGNRKGSLRDSIRVHKSKYSGHIVYVGGKGPWGDPYYWKFLELGVPAYGISKERHRFIRPALEKNKRKVSKILKEALE